MKRFSVTTFIISYWAPGPHLSLRANSNNNNNRVFDSDDKSKFSISNNKS